MKISVKRAAAAAGIAVTLSGVSAVLAPQASAAPAKATCGGVNVVKIYTKETNKNETATCFINTGPVTGIAFSKVTRIEAGAWIVNYSSTVRSGRVNPHQSISLSGVSHISIDCIPA